MTLRNFKLHVRNSSLHVINSEQSYNKTSFTVGSLTETSFLRHVSGPKNVTKLRNKDPKHF